MARRLRSSHLREQWWAFLDFREQWWAFLDLRERWWVLPDFKPVVGAPCICKWRERRLPLPEERPELAEGASRRVLVR
ncbi:hypothetical protein A9310_01560 [Gordonia sp. UCD-TK1]|nr:hypothetical protein A9310_01560 [Gordonia sp. UCD-TK1]